MQSHWAELSLAEDWTISDTWWDYTKKHQHVKLSQSFWEKLKKRQGKPKTTWLETFRKRFEKWIFQLNFNKQKDSIDLLE